MKIALLGYGKMGKEIEQIALLRGHTIVLKVSGENASTFSDSELKQADVAIEFSVPECAVKNLQRAFRVGIPIVSGTTGWLNEFESIEKECIDCQGSFFYASNYSIGVNIFFRLNKFLARIMNNYPEYDPSMKEVHHVHKKDSPSGTGITLATDLVGLIDRKTSWSEHKNSPENILKIESLRVGEVPGTHSIHYESATDTISINHVAHNRNGFATGAVLAAEFIHGKKGIFGMNDLMSSLPE
jgi:4-hydroxy-tetrahydrodipicolinate reductase